MDQKQRYDQIWKHSTVQRPEIWSVWKIIKYFRGKKNLEIGPGSWPKIPIRSGYFLDISESAINNLSKLGANAVVGDVIHLPFENNFFDLVVAIEVIEHIKDDRRALSEIARVLKPSGFLLFSVPLRMDLYSEIDRIVGHERRYEIEDLRSLLHKSGFKVTKYRHPSRYLILIKIIDKIGKPLHITQALFKSEKSVNFFNLPKPFVNPIIKFSAFIEKKGAPKWRQDIDNLNHYQDSAIVLLCQKE